MNHKRGKRKNVRSGCLMCKPWKMNGARNGGRKEKEWAKRQQMKKEIQEEI